VNAPISWVVVVGTTVDTQYLLGTICTFLLFINSTWKLTYTPDIKQLLHTPAPEPSSRATMFLTPRPKYLNEWWTSGSGEETPLYMELLQVAYSPPDMVDPIPSTATHVRPMDLRMEVTSPLPGLQGCTQCIAYQEISRRAVVALRDCGSYGRF
jgi:hypothetical protein